MKYIFVAVLLFVPIAAAARAIPPPSPVPSVTPSAKPSSTPIPSPSPTPTPFATPTPMPTPLVLPPNAQPQILAVEVSDPIFHSGEMITGTVITSTNVASVQLHIAGYAIGLPRRDFGIFELSYQIPHIPFFARRNYPAQLVATTAAGVTAERSMIIPIR